MTKMEIANLVHERVGLSKKESAELVDDILECIRSSLASHENVKLSGFGHFRIRHKHERRGRNPKTGQEIMITPRSVVTFRASPLLKAKLNQGDES
ncbi:MAG: integration host factor subunit alpha [Zetaproteobacteria bacterium]|nr:MAG: integration host factor subunit alpha [Zetaproteobacteria bacterium]